MFLDEHLGLDNLEQTYFSHFHKQVFFCSFSFRGGSCENFPVRISTSTGIVIDKVLLRQTFVNIFECHFILYIEDTI